MCFLLPHISQVSGGITRSHSQPRTLPDPDRKVGDSIAQGEGGRDLEVSTCFAMFLECLRYLVGRFLSGNCMISALPCGRLCAPRPGPRLGMVSSRHIWCNCLVISSPSRGVYQPSRTSHSLSPVLPECFSVVSSISIFLWQPQPPASLLFPSSSPPSPACLLQVGFAGKLLTDWSSSNFPHRTNS